MRDFVQHFTLAIIDTRGMECIDEQRSSRRQALINVAVVRHNLPRPGHRCGDGDCQEGKEDRDAQPDEPNQESPAAHERFALAVLVSDTGHHIWRQATTAPSVSTVGVLRSLAFYGWLSANTATESALVHTFCF